MLCVSYISDIVAVLRHLAIRPFSGPPKPEACRGGRNWELCGAHS